MVLLQLAKSYVFASRYKSTNFNSFLIATKLYQYNTTVERLTLFNPMAAVLVTYRGGLISSSSTGDVVLSVKCHHERVLRKRTVVCTRILKQKSKVIHLEVNYQTSTVNI